MLICVLSCCDEYKIVQLSIFTNNRQAKWCKILLKQGSQRVLTEQLLKLSFKCHHNYCQWRKRFNLFLKNSTTFNFYVRVIFRWTLSEWGSDCCLVPTYQFFSYIFYNKYLFIICNITIHTQCSVKMYISNLCATSFWKNHHQDTLIAK
jgi:hypothetical protein